MQIFIVTTSQTPQCGIYFLQIGEQEWWYYTMGEDLFVCSDQNVIQFRIWSAKIKWKLDLHFHSEHYLGISLWS